MGVFKHPHDLNKEGSRDAKRHQDKLKDQFRKKLQDIVSEEDVITGDGSKKVKVPIKGLDEYRFIFDNKKTKHTGQGNEDTEEGDIIWIEQPGQGDKAGDEQGDEIYEAEVDLDWVVQELIALLELPKLEPKSKADITVPEIIWNDIAKRGSIGNMHKKRTMIENMKRNAKETGKAKFGNIKKEDMRYKSWREELRPITSAVVFAAMDVSGSMTDTKKFLARSFYFWMTQFLKLKYDRVEIVFIAHTTEAWVVNEHDFFHRMESGGTRVSSAYIKMHELIETKYSPDLWNIFAFHFSDGETFGDEAECVKLINELCQKCNMVGYGEIETNYDFSDGWGGYTWSTLFSYYAKELKNSKFVQRVLKDKDDIWPTLQYFFGEQEPVDLTN